MELTKAPYSELLEMAIDDLCKEEDDALVAELVSALEYCNDLIKMRMVKGTREKIALEKIAAALSKAKGE